MEEKLLKAKEEAEQATKIKSEFLSVMSHEIRTPLNGVIGLTQLLMGSHPRPDQQEKLKLLQFSANNLLSLLNDILDFNKIEAGKLTLEFISFNLVELLTHTVRMFESNAREKNLSLMLLIDDHLEPSVKGDPVRFSQVLTNLISNAVKFTDRGRIEVRAWQDDDKKYQFAVSDSGIGIAEDRLAAIFESFTQAETNTTRRYGGSGLGLTISKQLVDMMGGTLRVESRVGKGSTFSFGLVFQKGDDVAVPREAKEFRAISRRTQRVLLAEDDPVSQTVTMQFLYDWGLDVRAVSNGSDALDLINAVKFDLVLLDNHLPDKLGSEVVSAVRKLDDEYYKTLPIIIMTASTVGEVRHQLLDIGVTDVIGKPFESSELRELINHHLNSGTDFLAPLFSDTIFIDGDPEFKSSLIELIIGNISELKEKINSGDKPQWQAAIHKSKTALKYLNHAEINSLLGEIHSNDFEEIAPDMLARLNILTEEVILNLRMKVNELLG